MSTLQLIISLLLGLLFSPICLSSNILFLSPFPVQSHWMWLNHFVRDLLDRGHHLTTLSNYPTKEPHPNLTEIIIDPKFEIPSFIPKETIFQMRFANDFENVHLVWNVGLITTEYAFKDSKVKALIADKQLKFDLVILEQFFHESFLMFAYKFKCPIVTIGTLSYADGMDHAMGALTPWSIVPHQMLSYSDHMSFKERGYNALVSWYDNFMRSWSYIPQMQAMAKKYFSEHIEGRLPHVSELEKNISFMLINSHRAIDYPRPKMPGLIDVGGAHIKPNKSLPSDLQHFLDKSVQGVIYFSLGSYVKSTDMPIEKLSIILKAFSKLKQNILWKFENDSIVNLPPNVMVRKWMPQNDILAHHNIKVFMTHGGIFGTQEGIYWGVPLLCIPLYADQHRNTIKAVRGGYARSLNFAEMTMQNILVNLQLLLNEPEYGRKAKEISQKFRDNPKHPLDEAAFWIEYAIRHKGASHLKSAGTLLSWYQYLLLDIIGSCLFGIVIILWIGNRIFKALRASVKSGSKKHLKEKKL